MLRLQVLLTINNSIYCCRYQTTDIIISCTLIDPWFLFIFTRLNTDVVPEGIFGPFHVIVQAGLQFAVQLTGPTLSNVSFLV